MMRFARKKRFRGVACVFLAAVILLTSLGTGSIAAAAGEERSFDIGVNADSVTAVLDGNGVLTISGVGDTKDYTPETAPFSAVFDRIVSVKIGAGVSSLGNCLFYNCGRIAGELELPEKLARIGDQAFSGDQLQKAPKPELVINPFQEVTVAKPKETPSPLLTPSPEAAKETGEAAAVKASEEEARAAAGGAEESAVSSEQPGESAAPESGPAPQGSPSPEASPAPEASASPEATVEPGVLLSVSPAASASPAPSPSPEAENRFQIETLTEQEIGADVFFPLEENGVRFFSCSEGNGMFRAAMERAGYREADSLVSAVFDCGEGTSSTGGALVRKLPLSQGKLVLPQVPAEFSPPEGGELFTYSFGGWTESKDEAGVTRRPGTEYEPDGRQDLYFIAGWNREVLVRIQVERKGDTLRLAVPEIGGYEVTSYRWQTCALEQGREAPADEEQLLWEDLPGETGPSYQRTLEAGDENRFFRCVVTVVKQQGFLRALFGMNGEEELALSAVRGAEQLSTQGMYGLTCERGGYGSGETALLPTGDDPETVVVGQGDYAVIPSCPYTAPVSPEETVVFNGWMGGDGKTYDPGEMVRLTESLTLTAQWAAATVRYVESGAAGASGGSGTKSAPYRNLDDALKSFPGGSFYTNYVVLLSNLADGTGLDRVPQNFASGANATVTSMEPGGAAAQYTLTLDNNGAKLGGDIRFENIKITRKGDVYAQGHTLVMGENVVATDESLCLYGGYPSGNAGGSPRLLVQSGSYLSVYGGNYEGTLTGDPLVCISGSAQVGLVFGAGCYIGSSVVGNTEVLLSGNSSAAAAVGGGRSSDGGAGVSGKAHVMVGGSARIEDVGGAVKNHASVAFDNTGFVAGSGADACRANGAGNVRGGTLVEIRENAFVEKNVFGGSGDGWSDKTITDSAQNAWIGTTGDMEVVVSGGAVGGSVYGGGNSRSCQGSSRITVLNGAISGDVFGGGRNGNVDGSAQVTVSGGTIRGAVYGGGDQGTVTENCGVEVTGGSVAGNIYGGGKNGDLSGGSASVAFGGEAAAGGSLYGGGDQGAVAKGASVTVTGGTVSGNVFGGGKGLSGSSEIGAVTGNTLVTITGGTLGSYTGSAGETFDQSTGSVYGGGEFAQVKAGAESGLDGDSGVILDVPPETGRYPTIGGSIYGGGSRAAVERKSSVQLKNGRVGGSVYGAGYGAESTVNRTEVAVLSGAVGGNVFGGGAEGTVASGTEVAVSGGSMQNVFAAGEGNETAGVNSGRVSGSASVTVSGGTVSGGLYGGGYLGLVGTGSDITADAGVTTGSAQVSLSGGTVERLFGGGSGSGNNPAFGTVFGHTTVTVTGGTVTGNVYGGSNYAYVTGNTQVSLQKASVGGSVFGGGNLNRNPEEGFDNNSFLVLGGSSVLLDGNGGLTIAGSVFGSGNLTRVQGSKTLTIENYTGALQSIQRTSLTNIRNSDIVLSGADDITDDQGSKLFSITKVDDLRLISSTLCLEAEARELGALGNYDGSDAVSAAEAGRSTLRAVPGLLLQILPSQESGSVGNYGPVSGVLWLEMAGDASGGRGVRIEADETGDIGDGTDGNTGAFLRKDTPANQGLEMVSGAVAGSHRFWRLGGSVLERTVTLAALRSEAGGQATAVQTFQIPTSAGSSFYKITEMKKISGDFTLVKPVEDTAGAMTLPPFSGSQEAGNTFALRSDATDSENRGTWEVPPEGAAQWGAYVLTQLPESETEWNSGVPGVWKKGNAYPTTAAGGAGAGNNAEFTLSLVYDSSYEAFSGGELELTFQEYRAGGSMSESDRENTVVVKLTLEGEESGYSQAAYVDGGRKFGPLDSQEPVSLTEDGAVTASFSTSYYPAAAGAEHMYLSLYGPDSGEPAAFPEGTSVVLADSTQAEHRYYFYRTAAGEQKISLAGFTSMGGSGSVVYPGPASNADRISEKLLFAVDFSGTEAASRLAQGDYSLYLTHAQGEIPASAAPARFSITTGQNSTLGAAVDAAGTTDALVSLKLTPQVFEGDTRYADGAGIRLALSDSTGRMKAFPSKMQVGGAAQGVLRNADGTVSFALPASGESVVTLDFSAVPETMLASGGYQATAYLRPRTGLQMGSNQGAPDAEAVPVEFTLKRETQAQRAVSVALNDSSKRLADVSQAEAQLEFTVSAEMEPGDTLETELLRKTGSTPDDSSYGHFPEGEGWCAVGAFSSGSANAVLTLPQGTESGTYRIVFRVADSAGTVLAEEPYNFIIK